MRNKVLIHLPSGKSVPAGKFSAAARPWEIDGRDGVWWLERDKRGDSTVKETFRPNGHHHDLFLSYDDAVALAAELNGAPTP